MSNKKSVFETLNAVDVSDKTEKKNNLTYLSWPWAWGEVKKRYPDATYEVNQMEYTTIGYMCHTTVTIEGESLKMWLPVMDGANRSMKETAYEGQTKWGKEYRVEAATMFDINKTIMRCLVKNLAMFGLGLYIYAGEDLPESDTTTTTSPTTTTTTTTAPAKKEGSSQKLTLKKGDENWTKVAKFIAANKSKGLESIIKTLGTKYTITDTVKKTIKSEIDG